MKLSTIIKRKKEELKRVNPKQRDRVRSRLKSLEMVRQIRKECAA